MELSSVDFEHEALEYAFITRYLLMRVTKLALLVACCDSSPCPDGLSHKLQDRG